MLRMRLDRGCMSHNSLFDKLSAWYLEQCNGIWEHAYGVLIDTLDNPGWQVKIDLNDTKFQDAKFETMVIIKSENDWINCQIKDHAFIGVGDPSKLGDILEVFLKIVGKA